MSMLIPFANAIPPPSTDRSITGALHSMTPVTVSPAAVSTAASPANTLLLFGDNTSGTIQWSDETVDANSQLNSDTPVFNSDGDQYYIDMVTNDVIDSLDWYVSAAGVYTSTITATVSYRDLTGTLVQQAGLAMPIMTTIGIKRLMLSSAIDAANVGLSNDPRDPSAALRKALFVKFSVTGGTITTAPLAQRFWKRRILTAIKAVTDFTALVGTGDKTPFLPVTTLALNGDLTLEGIDAKSATGFVTITRSREAGLLSELVYSKGAGVFGTIPAADLYITSGIAGNDELWQAAAGQYVDAWIPPTDWVKDTITVGVTDHTKYWFGWRVTQDTPPRPWSQSWNCGTACSPALPSRASPPWRLPRTPSSNCSPARRQPLKCGWCSPTSAPNRPSA